VLTQELLGLLNLPGQAMAMVQQLNYNLETLQGGGGMEQIERLNTNLESMAPELGKLTAALTSLVEHIWGQKIGG
jgi:hypothetical protein